MATINLGSLKLNWTGAYNSSTTYAVDDIATANGNSYVCIQAHSNQAVGNATAYWNIMSSAGTNGTDGTDLSSTLTTRGDIVYKGASALTRLPKGTAGYYLKQGANDPEWSAVSGGDVVKLATVTVSAASTIAVDGHGSWIDNTVYDSYLFVFKHISTSNDSSSSNVYFRLNSGGSQLTGAAYYQCVNTNDLNSSSSADGSTRIWAGTTFGLSHNNMDSEAYRSGYGTLEILGTGGNDIGASGSYYPHIQHHFFSHHSNSSTVYQMISSGYYQGTDIISGITLYPDSGNIDDGIITVYGRKR